ncbi:MAG: hypothetical protein PHE50_10320, partial [Dehalococcoidales bacterium]|nr:hypothetical protein [Dehalococcoidales bacterium]
IAIYNSLSFLGFSLGSFVGGVALPPLLALISGNFYISIFLVSGIIRLIFAVIFIPRITEVRAVQNYSTRAIFLDDVSPVKLRSYRKTIGEKLSRLKPRK